MDERDDYRTPEGGSYEAPPQPARTSGRATASRDGREREDEFEADGRQTGGHLTARSVFVAGAALFIATTVALFSTGNPNLYPTVTLIGSFLVPATFVAFLYDHQHRSTLAFEAIVRGFIAGGVLGILAASVLEPVLLPRIIDSASVQANGGALTFSGGVAVGVIEEGCKLLAVIIVGRRLHHIGALDGLLLGAAVGMGFAALESSGYAFTTLLASQGDVAASLVETVVRALFAPFGHGVWTAILAAILFQQSRAHEFRFTPLVIVTFAFVSVLHGAWDGLQGAPAVVLPFDVGISWSMIVVGGGGLVALALIFRWAVARQAEAESEGLLPTPD